MTDFKDGWFKWLRESTEGLLLEGVEDIGLPDRVLEQLQAALYNASEKAKVYMGNNWKKAIPNALQYDLDYITKEFVDNYFPERTDLNFELQNLRDMLTDQKEGANGRLKKKLKKLRRSLNRKVGAESEEGQEAVNKFMEFIERQLYSRTWHNFSQKYDRIFEWLNIDPTNYEYVKGRELNNSVDVEFYNRQTREKQKVSFPTLQDYIKRLLLNQEEPDQILHVFDEEEEDALGYYWYNTGVNNCPVEAERMGHCGRDDEGVLVSLRQRDPANKWSDSYVTMTWDEGSDRIVQIKGRHNNAPDEDLWPYIAWFINEYGIESVEETGEHSNDVHRIGEMVQWLHQETGVSVSDPEADLEGAIEELADGLQQVVDNFDQPDDLPDNVSIDIYFGEVDGDIDDYHNEVNTWFSAGATVTVEIDLQWDAYGGVDPNTNGRQGWWLSAEEVTGAGHLSVPSHAADWGDRHAFERAITPASVYVEDTEWAVQDDGFISIDFRYDCDDCSDAQDFDYFADRIQADWATSGKEYLREIMLDLIEQGAMPPMEWDNFSEQIVELANTVTNFDTYVEEDEEEVREATFEFQESIATNLVNSGVTVSTEQYGLALTLVKLSLALNTTPMYPGRPNVHLYSSEEVSTRFYEALAGVESDAAKEAARQLKFAFVQNDLPAKAIESGEAHPRHSQIFFKLQPVIDGRPVAFMSAEASEANAATIMFSYRLEIKETDTADDIQTTINLIKILDEYPDLVYKAARQAFEGQLNSPEAQRYLDNPDPPTLPDMLGEPQPVSPDMQETRILEIDDMLNEDDPLYDLRIYRMKLNVSLARDRGGEMQETQTEIRGIESVTTVRTVGDTQRIGEQAIRATFEVKFELLGTASRTDYYLYVFKPALMAIKGLTLLGTSPIEQINVRGSIRTVRESKIFKEYYGAGFGGLAGGLGSVRSPGSPPRPTPAPSLQAIVDDWAEGGVQLYDIPSDTTEMAYHLMMPVKELARLLPRADFDSPTHERYRGGPMDFDGRYHHFIAKGPQAPVVVAVGQNGRAKITGNEDAVWFAKKSGLEELPVFISYQKQA